MNRSPSKKYFKRSRRTLPNPLMNPQRHLLAICPAGEPPVFTHFDIPSYNRRVFSVVNTMPVTHPLLHSTRITAHDNVITFENALQHHTFTTQAHQSAPSSQRPSSRIWISTLLACPSPGKVMAAPRCTHRPSYDKK